MSKYTRVDDDLHAYLLEHRTPDDPVLDELRRETRDRFGRAAGMQVSPEQTTLMALLVRISGARRILEIGTFTGTSALAMARALPADGQLIALDVSEEFTEVARRYWEKAGVAERIELRIGPAEQSLAALPLDPPFDLAFVDANKTSYDVYYEGCLERLRPDGLLLLDNVLWGGAVVDPDNQSDDTRAIRALNDKVARDERVQSVMVGISDGLTLVRKRARTEA